MKKKILFICLIGASSLTGCSKQSNSLKILCPTGAPSLAFYNFANNEQFETTGDPQASIIPSFQTGQYDILVAPTQGGINQIVNQKAPYKIAATITFGNFYILSSGFDTDNVLNSGDSIIVFNQNDVPGRIFTYCYGDLGLDVTYVSSVDLTKQAINSGFVYDGKKYDYIYTAEPVVAVTNTKDKIKNIVSDDFTNKTNCKLTQASIYVHNGANKSMVDSFLSNLKKDIDNGINNPDLIKNALDNYGSNTKQQAKFGLNSTIAKKVMEYNGVSLGFEVASDIKEDITCFMHVFPQFKDIEIDEEIFYK